MAGDPEAWPHGSRARLARGNAFSGSPPSPARQQRDPAPPPRWNQKQDKQPDDGN
jgi:hypothetical protein